MDTGVDKFDSPHCLSDETSRSVTAQPLMIHRIAECWSSVDLVYVPGNIRLEWP